MVMPRILFSALVCLLLAAAPGFAQTVSIVSGQGQATDSFGNSFGPLVVEVRDASGFPMPGVQVDWAVTDGDGLIAVPGTLQSLPGWSQAMTTITDADGRTSVAFQQPQPAMYIAYEQSTVTAAVGTLQVVFYETRRASMQSNPSLLRPEAVTMEVTGESGQPLKGAVRVAVGAPNVALEVVAYNNDPGTGAACVASPGQPAGLVLSDALGIAECDLVLSGIGRGNFRISVGDGYYFWSPFSFEVTPGLPCIIQVISGNNQSGKPGQVLPRALVAEVSDCAGVPLEGVPVAWTVSPPASGTLSSASTASGSNGRVSARLTPAGGPVQVQVAVAEGTKTANNAPVSVTFAAEVEVAISGLQKFGDEQAAVVDTEFEQPIKVQVNDAEGKPLSGVPVSFMVRQGKGSLAATPVWTNEDGQASTAVTAGSEPGELIIVAATRTLTAEFTLTVLPPGPANITFENGAGFQQNWLSPCGVATIRGTGLAPGIQGAVVPDRFGVQPLPYRLADVRVRFGETLAPIFSVVNLDGQESVSVQVPCELTPGVVPVTIEVGETSAQVEAEIRNVAPGIFEWFEPEGALIAVLVRPDGSYVTQENPARLGEVIRMYVTGIGLAEPAVATNSRGVPDTESLAVEHAVAGVNNAGVAVISAKYVDIGVYEVAFEVPAEAPAGNLPLQIAVYQGEGNELVFGNTSVIPVQ